MTEVFALRISRLLVGFLRLVSGKTQTQIGREARVDQSQLSLYEHPDLTKTKRVPEDNLRRLAAAAGVPWPLVVLLRRFFEVFLAVLDGWAGAGLEAEARPEGDRDLALAEVVDLAAFPHLFELRGSAHAEGTPEEERRAAAAAWEVLAPLPPARIRQLIDRAPRAASSWALAERISHASEERAAGDVEEALELARLALAIAERVPGEGRRSRTSGYSLFDLANCRRVANDFDEADSTFERAWALWHAGAGADAPPLAEWRPLYLEASLRRAQHRYAEALDRLDRARAASGGDPEVTARILLKKEHILEQQGDAEGALAVLAEAAQAVEDAQDPRLRFLHRHKIVLNLWHLGRHAEAEKLLPEVRALAAAQGKKLDGIRVRWLGARVDAGLGRREEAIAALEEVQAFFLDPEAGLPLPYDAALAALDLAVLYLKAGETARVRELALAMAPIFKAQGIEREALAALKLFCQAAREETATVELARKAAAALTVGPPVMPL